MHAGGLGRVAALVNDFGAIGIDAELVASVADEVVQLTNGCVCCTINGDLFAAAERVLALDPAVDRIIVETTGLADPLPVGLTFLQTELRRRTVLDAVITVVDSANFALDLFKIDAAMAQIVHADIIVINKTDLVDEAVVAVLEARIRVLKPRVRTLRAVSGRVPLAAVLGQEDGGAALSVGSDAKHAHGPHDGFRAYSYRFDELLSARRFQDWLDTAVPVGVFRAKGLVRFDNGPNAYVFQLCGARASFEPFNAAIEDTRLVFIGRGIDGDALEKALKTCRVPFALEHYHRSRAGENDSEVSCDRHEFEGAVGN